MDLQPNSDELQIIESAARFLQQEWPVRRLHAAHSERLPPQGRLGFATLGWFGISLPEQSGGAGFSLVEEVLLYRELGRVLGPTGILPISLAARICAGQQQDLTAQLLRGERAVALCFSEYAEPELALKRPVRTFNAEEADTAVLVTDEVATVVQFTPEAFTSRPCLDKSVSMGIAELRGAAILASAPSASVIAVARLCVAAMLVGIAEAVTGMIVDYAKIRQTFGRPIGAYQAVRHPCAEMAVRSEIARALLFYAAVAFKEGRADAPLQADTAKFLANEAALTNVDANIQLHGGIGTTDEHDAHLFMKRAHVLNRWFGSNKALGARILRAPVLD